MLELKDLPERLTVPESDTPSELFRAQERIRELERDALGLRSELVVRRKQASDAADELARYRRAFQGGWRTLKVMRNQAREAMQVCEDRLAELKDMDALRARVAELEAQLETRLAEVEAECARHREAREAAEAEAARWREEADIRLELQEFLNRQVEAERRRAEEAEARVRTAGRP